MCGGVPVAWLPSPMMAGLGQPQEDSYHRHHRHRQRQRRLLWAEDGAASAEAGRWGGGAGAREGGAEGGWRREGQQAGRALKGFTVMGAGCGKSKEYKVQHENDGAGPSVRKNPKPSEQPLIDCIRVRAGGQGGASCPLRHSQLPSPFSLPIPVGLISLPLSSPPLRTS